MTSTVSTPRAGKPSLCGSCGECNRGRQAARQRAWWRGLTPEQRAERIARRDAARVREQDRRKQAQRRTAGSDDQLLKIAARNAVRLAKRRGSLAVGACEQEANGGCAGPIHAHHDDYSRPLDVRWLCRCHHDALHAGGDH